MTSTGTSGSLRKWWPESGPWNRFAAPLFDDPRWAELERFVQASREQGPVFPAAEDVFSAFALTPPSAVRVVILGQDPYHRPGQAHGLSFSVRRGNRLPPSLRNIFLELENDLGFQPPECGDLTGWARSGVLLLNTILTVSAGQPLSHQGKGWEWFTDRMIGAVSSLPQPVVFVLWGKPAQQKSALVDSRHLQIRSMHPSPLSAWRGFFGSRPFSTANAWLVQQGSEPVCWDLGNAGGAG